MFLDSSSSKAASGKTYRRVLLRTSFRVDGKVKHRTLGNLSDCDPSEICLLYTSPSPRDS